MRRYRVILAVEIGGAQLTYGAIVELDDETAAAYAHALVEVEA